MIDSEFLRRRLALLRVGETAELTVRRDGKLSNVKLAVAERDPRAPPEMKSCARASRRARDVAQHARGDRELGEREPRRGDFVDRRAHALGAAPSMPPMP